MSEILSQAEIEALLNSLQEDKGQTDGAAAGSPRGAVAAAGAAATSNRVHNPSVTNTSFEVYDFRRPDKFSKEQLRTLQMLHETFGRVGGSALSSYLRTPVSLEIVSLEQIPYDEYLRSIDNSLFTIVSLPPLSGQAVLEIEFGMIFSMIDKLLGGPGRPIVRNNLTEIEQPMVRNLLDRIFGALKNAWEGVVIVGPTIDSMETSAQFVQIAPPNDIVVSILFEIRIGSVRGAMSLCIPYMVLKPVTTKLSAQKWFVASNRKQTTSNKRVISRQISTMDVDCAITLGKTKLNTQDFLKLKPGDMLRLDKRATGPIDFLVGGKSRFVGKPALDGKKLLFQIEGMAAQE